MTTTTAAATINAFRELTARHGSMEKLVTDNGPQWISVPFKNFCKEEAIDHITTAPYMPMSNGQAERFVDTFKRTTSKLGKLTEESVQRFLRSYRSTPNDRAPFGKSPAELIYGRRIRLPIAALLPPATPPSLARDKRMEDQFNLKNGAKQRDFIEGDEVLVKANQKSKWRNGQVIERVGAVMYNIIIQGRIIRAHANQIRRTGPTQPLEDQVDDYLYHPAAPAATSSPQPTEAPVTSSSTRPNWRAVTRTSPPNLRPRRR